MTIDVAKEQIARLKHEGCFLPMQVSAKVHGLPLEFVIAIASRESNCTNELGDYHDGAYHAVGVMQIDIQHEVAREAMASHSWKDHPAALIEYGCAMLAGGLAYAKAHVGQSGNDTLKFTAASYNAGLGGAVRGHQEGDCDRHTTGGNYGRDVVSRMPVFKKALAEGPRPPRTVATK